MRPKKILLVDDEVLVLSGLSRALQQEGTEITVAKSAEEALALVESTCYSLCFLDICLPGMDGLAAMRQIQRKSPETKIVIMTAQGLDGGIRASTARSAHYFITKPFDIEEVRAIAYEALSS